MRNLKLYVARHGETPYNEKNLICGISDVPLNENGRYQADVLASQLKNEEIDIIIASPLKRAQETAKIVASKLNKEVMTDNRLHEIDFGIFEGKPGKNEMFCQVKKNHAMSYPQGEKLFQVVQRVYNFLDEIRMKYQNQNVLVVCHGGILRVIHSYFYDMTNEQLFTWLPENCCCQVYENTEK